MKRSHGFPALVLCLLLMGLTACPDLNDDGGIDPANGWKLPPTGSVTRVYPRLVNYYHFSPNETPAGLRSERLAQWDIVVIFPYKAEAEHLDFTLMRQLHPDIKILAWIPIGQAPDTSYPFGAGIPPQGSNDWYLRDTDNGYVTLGAPYFEHIMNPYRENRAWADYIVSFARTNYLDNNLYDGVFLDCMWSGPPTWLYPAGGVHVDVDEDGDYDNDDLTAWRTGVSAALSGLKSQCPGKLVTGNNGVPLAAGGEYWNWIDGCYNENALGDEFGNPAWTGDSTCVWNGYQEAMTAGATHYMIGVDTRSGESASFDTAKSKNRLTADDRRRMRLGLCTTLLGDGYFGFDSGDCIHGQLWWFDEYDADLGNPVSGYSLLPNQLYCRSFAKGSVYVNPTDQHVIISTGSILKDATTNETNNRFIIPSSDGRILSAVTGAEVSNILLNGNFDYETFCWSFWANNGSAGFIDAENGALKATVTNPGINIWDIGITQTNVPIEIGYTYTASFQARADHACQIINLVQLNHDPWTIYSGNDVFNITTAMKTYSFTFTMNYPTDTGSFFVFHIGGNGTNTIYIDNVSLRKVD